MARLRASSTYAADLEGVHRRVAQAAGRDIERVLEVLDSRYGGPLGWLRRTGSTRRAPRPPRGLTARASTLHA